MTKRFSDRKNTYDESLFRRPDPPRVVESSMTEPLTPDQLAAHELLCQLRTRIATQPLPYQFGVEARALKSLLELFDLARGAMVKYPGCREFARQTTEMLNVTLRPLTAKWHRALEEGRLDSRDGSDDFRAELVDVQTALRAFAGTLQELAYGTVKADSLTPSALTREEIERCFARVSFGVVDTCPTLKSARHIDEMERGAIGRRRAKHGIHDAGDNAVGLSLSGGGIRSATFCLGVVQVLAERGLLKEVDFLSTVSGGGYIGGFLSARLAAETPESELGKPAGPDPRPIRELRSRAKFLSAANVWAKWRMVTQTLAGSLLNWSAPVALLALLALVAIFASNKPYVGPNPWSHLFEFSASASVLLLVVYGKKMRGSAKTAGHAELALAIALAATLLSAVGWLLHLGYHAWLELPFKLRVAGAKVGAKGAHAERAFTWWRAATTVVAGLVAAVPSIIRFVPVFKNPTVRTLALKAGLYLAGIVVPLVTVLVLYRLLALGFVPADLTTSALRPSHYPGPAVLAALAIGLFLVAYTLNVNLTGPHRLYRDAIGRAFIQIGDDGPPTLDLTTLNDTDTAPYHLINATLNIPSSETPGIRDRRADFFLFSKYWCGSPVTGYHRTGEWITNGAEPDLATAIAISGAAVSSRMGLDSLPTLSALMTLLNVRLGFWITRTARWKGRPGFWCLIREMTGIYMSEKQRWLNVSDGGHIENMGSYELLRRRCKFIICVDAEADPEAKFGGLMTLIRHAQIDFGVHIAPRLDELRPSPTTKHSQRHAILCRIDYPPLHGKRATGLFLYLKASITGNESELVRHYRDNHPEFPHQTTLDQFFDQEQFEAYRQLGAHVADGLFSPALIGGTTKPSTVDEWFRHLAPNLLDPEGS